MPVRFGGRGPLGLRGEHRRGRVGGGFRRGSSSPRCWWPFWPGPWLSQMLVAVLDGDFGHQSWWPFWTRLLAKIGESGLGTGGGGGGGFGDGFGGGFGGRSKKVLV